MKTQTTRGPIFATMDVNVEGSSTIEERLAWVDRVIADPPIVHQNAPDGAVWSTEASCYRFIAQQIKSHSRTLETGAGISTVLFAAWGCDHLAIVPHADEARAIEGYCDERGIVRRSLVFDLRTSDAALPTLSGSSQLDLLFIDGCHGFPSPIIDWFYGASLLRKGGIVVFDDVQLPQVSLLLKTFIEPDPRWKSVASTNKWSAFRRLSEGYLGEEWFQQPFFVSPSPQRGFARRAKDLIPLSIKKRLHRSANPGPLR